jgi:uncharacterized protein (TIGR02246 family)
MRQVFLLTSILSSKSKILAFWLVNNSLLFRQPPLFTAVKWLKYDGFIVKGIMNRENMIALVKRQAKAWQSRDPLAVSEDFAPDAVLISPSGRLLGSAAVHAAAEYAFATLTHIDIIIKQIVIDGDQGAVEWTWSETDAKTRQQKITDDAIIFTVQNNKIIYWREYIDGPL